MKQDMIFLPSRDDREEHTRIPVLHEVCIRVAAAVTQELVINQHVAYTHARRDEHGVHACMCVCA